jgi:deoxyribose-phosphate aldolase
MFKVAAGFPSGLFPLETRLHEIEFAVDAGAKEIDIVIERNLVITQNWKRKFTRFLYTIFKNVIPYKV